MKRILVEWMHLVKEGSTCDRCSETGNELTSIIEKLNKKCVPRGVSVHLKETELAETELGKSNLILVNGKAIEDILPDSQASESNCKSCSEITGNQESCRTIVQFGHIYETIPQQLIRKAVCKIAQCC